MTLVPSPFGRGGVSVTTTGTFSATEPAGSTPAAWVSFPGEGNYAVRFLLTTDGAPLSSTGWLIVTGNTPATARDSISGNLPAGWFFTNGAGGSLKITGRMHDNAERSITGLTVEYLPLNQNGQPDPNATDANRLPTLVGVGDVTVLRRRGTYSSFPPWSTNVGHSTRQ